MIDRTVESELLFLLSVSLLRKHFEYIDPDVFWARLESGFSNDKLGL